MALIMLDGKKYHVVDEVGDYIDTLVDSKKSMYKKKEAIERVINIWLNSERNNVENQIECLAFSIISLFMKDL